MDCFPPILGYFFTIYGLLIAATGLSLLLKKKIIENKGEATYVNIRERIRSWWVMMTLLVAALAIGKTGTIILFAFVSLLALREFITMTPTRASDHRTLCWVFFILLPYQYMLVYTEWYGLFSIFIPVYAFLIVPIRTVLKDDYERFLERTAKIQWGMMVSVYFISHIPALLYLNIDGFNGANVQLILFLILVSQLSDIFQYIVGKTFGKTKIAPSVSPNKTVEGFVGGVALAVLFGASLWKTTPFSMTQAALIAAVIGVVGFFGGLTMSAIKRDRGIKDYGNLIPGHGGMLDRIDSLCFAAPVYFHIIRYYFAN